jgi:hypothetical protein
LTLTINTALLIFPSSHALADCRIPDVTDKVQFTLNKASCLKESAVLLPLPMGPKAIQEILNPTGNSGTLINNQTIYCRFHFQEQNGNSAKFRCVQTNEKNQLIDSKGHLELEATSTIEENDEIYLLNSKGQKLSNEEGDGFKKSEPSQSSLCGR